MQIEGIKESAVGSGLIRETILNSLLPRLKGIQLLQYTLFERLRKPQATIDHSVGDVTAGIMRSILHNLKRVLNARKGQSPAQMEFGITSPSDMASGYPESVYDMQREIRDAIERYEPRLTDVQLTQIESEDDKLVARFQISAKLADASNPRHVAVGVIIDPYGGVSLTA